MTNLTCQNSTLIGMGGARSRAFFKIIALLRQNSYTIKFTHLVYAVQWLVFSIVTESHNHTINLEHFYLLQKETLHLLDFPFILNPSPRSPLIYFLSL